MTPEQAKYLLPFIKAFSEGKTIQVQSEFSSDVWHDLVDPNFTSKMAYRVKPNPIVVKYRRFLCKRTETRYYVDTCCSVEGVNHAEALSNFVRWIDTDWVTEVV